MKSISISITLLLSVVLMLASLKRSYSQSQKTAAHPADSITLMKLTNGTTKIGYVIGDRDSLLIFSTHNEGVLTIRKSEIETQHNVLKQSVYKEEKPTPRTNPGATSTFSHTSFTFTSVDQVKKRIISFEIFAPLNSHLAFGYEQMIAHQISMKGELGIIGIGVVEDSRASKGAYLKAGPKFYFSSDWTMDGLHRINDLQGAYFMPQLEFSYFKSTDYHDSYPNNTGKSTTRTSTSSYALLFNLGKQWVVAQKISVDLHYGLGFGGNNFSGKGDVTNQYGHRGGTRYNHLAQSAGIGIGVLIK